MRKRDMTVSLYLWLSRELVTFDFSLPVKSSARICDEVMSGEKGNGA